jgi:hypothetical protein
VIHRSTAFILGAGTSKPYRFPTGEELLRAARRLGPNDLRSKLHAPEPRYDPVANLLHEALQRTHDASLDALLELRPDIAPLGKRLIASLMLEFESNSKPPLHFPEPNDDWLTLFFTELTAGTKSLAEFERLPVTLITYNYDRLLEYRLVGALAVHYGRSEEHCVAALKKIPIIHLHGDLGLLPAFAPDGEPSVPFGPASTDAQFPVYVDYAANRVIIVHEAKADTNEYRRAVDVLSRAKQIVLLGFGYGATNLARLQLPSWTRNIGVIGTVYGLTPSRILYDVRAPFEAAGIQRNPGHPPVDPKFGTREFLENSLGIFRS